MPVAVVTGGARGIGLAIGEWFLAHGYAVVLIDNDRETLEATAARLDVLALHCDVSDPAAVAAAAASVMATRSSGAKVRASP